MEVTPASNFYQILGGSPAREPHQDDIITAIQFEKRGDYLATGDQGGRVVIFEKDDRNFIEPLYPHKFLEGLDSSPAQRPKFRYKSEFQSHKPEIDSFSNKQVAEAIKKVSWCVVENGLLLLLSANKKTIKLWTIKERKTEKLDEVIPHGRHRFYSSENVLVSYKRATLSSANGQHWGWIYNLYREDPPSHGIYFDDEIEGYTGNTLHAKCQKVYAQYNSSNINSISNNSDAQTFISADEFRINLWNLEVSDRNFNIIDMKPSNTEEPYEMITTAEFHPVHCNLLAYGSSQGLIRISDLRQAARCDGSVTLFPDRSLFRMKFPSHEMAACISDVKFLVDGIGGQQLISRDYMNMKLWDVRKDSRPVATFRIHEHPRPRKLAESYNKENIFDQFGCCCSRDGLNFATGSYGNRLKIFSTGRGSVEDIKLDIIGNFESIRIPVLPEGTVRRSPIVSNMKGGGIEDELDCKLGSKLLNVAWHPTSNLVTAAFQSSLIMYQHNS